MSLSLTLFFFSLLSQNVNELLFVTFLEIAAFFSSSSLCEKTPILNSSLYSETSCTPACPLNKFCFNNCLDGNKACLDSPTGTCCGCVSGHCWSCPTSSECNIGQPFVCRRPETHDYSIYPVVGFGLVIIFLIVVGCTCCRRTDAEYAFISQPSFTS